MALFKTGKNKDKAIKALEEYIKKGGEFKDPEPLILLYKAYSTTIYTKKAEYYLKVLLNNFPFHKEVIPLKIKYIKRMLDVRNWSEALFYLIDLEDKGYSKQFPIILFYIGKAYYQKGTYEIASEYFRKYLKIKPEYINYSADDLFSIGKSFYAVTDYKNALKILLAFINIYPKNSMVPEAMYLIGDIFFQQKNYKLSAIFLNEVINKYGNYPISNKAKIRIADSVSHLTKSQMERLKIPYYLKQPEKVYRSIIKKTTSLKDKHLAFVKLIEFYKQRGEAEQGMFELFKYLKTTLVDPEGEKIYRKYFDDFLKKTKDKNRILMYFLRTNKDTTFLKNYEIEKLAKIMKSLNLYEMEKLLLNRMYILSTKRDEKRKILIRLLENSYNLLDWKEFKKNIELFQRLYPLEKLPPQIKLGLVEYYISENKIKKAYDFIKLNLKNFKSGNLAIKAYILLLKLEIKQNRWKEAERTLQILSRKKINSPKDKTEILVPAAIVYMKNNKKERAISTLKLTLKTIPESKAWALFHLGRIYYMAGDVKTGSFYWQRLKSIYPDNFWTKQIDLITILSKKNKNF